MFGKTLKLTFLVLGAGWAATAAAQNLGFMYDSPSQYFNDQDRKLFEETVLGLLDNGKSGEQRKWRNDASRNGGAVTVTNSTRKLDGNPCRHLKVSNYAYNGLKATSTLEVCKKPDGRWAIVGV
jgi:surface antigen